jgi:hypothetical protein
MRYLTHHFAHTATLARARRWLIQAGVSPDRILVHDQGLPWLTVAAEPAEVDSIKMIVRIAGINDPDGLPGLWDVPHNHPMEAVTHVETTTPPPHMRPSSFPLAWHAVDTAGDEGQREQIELQKTYLEMHP